MSKGSTRPNLNQVALADGEGAHIRQIDRIGVIVHLPAPAVKLPTLNSLCDPIHAHSIVSPSRSPTALN